jgi:SOS-response transcriptional repressor LexA
MATEPHQETDGSPEEHEHRRVLAANLKRAMIERGENQSSLADKSGVGQSTIGRYLRAETTANSYILKQLADALQISVNRITSDSTRPGIEPNVINQAVGANVQDGPNLAYVPLIPWGQLGAWQMDKAQADTWLPCPVPCGPKTFAVKVRGVSMEPKFFDGDVIFVDPDVIPKHGRRVIAKVDGEMIFRELIIDGDRRFLTWSNPNFPGNRLTELSPTAQIVGVIVGKWVPEI